ncbi:MAG: lipoprotein [Burkholderiaceae bacterium]
MSSLPPSLARIAAATLAAAVLGGCGQKGPLFIPHTPAAAQRATLPQTVFGGPASPAAAPASRASAAPPPPLPNLPEIQ